ncbi:hypothetical protein CAEBREN_03165 [Caenorhabditis brenneri]|uniref:Uncharacterized protein n=1 Tax=Caenorhabditis brenneri TaxID=135651 RepID=G0P1A7_CAEBE|nr:hypothetical protein CAEBREN_03165 [Caenorhabditis brenneri]
MAAVFSSASSTVNSNTPKRSLKPKRLATKKLDYGVTRSQKPLFNPFDSKLRAKRSIVESDPDIIEIKRVSAKKLVEETKKDVRIVEGHREGAREGTREAYQVGLTLSY